MRIEVNDRDLKHIADVMLSARKLQEFLWADTREPGDNFDHWKKTLQKRLDKIEVIDFSEPHSIIELRKRLLQNAVVSVAWLRALDSLEARQPEKGWICGKVWPNGQCPLPQGHEGRCDPEHRCCTECNEEREADEQASR